MTDPLSATFDTSDLDRLVRNLNDRAPAVGADAARDAAEWVAGRARANFPRLSGRLAGSVGVEADRENEARVYVGAPYAGFVEYGGTRGRAYVPDGRYLGPAVDGSEQVFEESAARGLDKAAR